MWLTAQMKGIDTLNKEIQGVLMCPQRKLRLFSVFVPIGPDMVPKVKYFRNLSTDFNKQGLK